MYVESCTILVVVNRLSRPIVVLDGLPGLYGFKYNSATACGLPLYLYSYKLVGSATMVARVRLVLNCMDMEVAPQPDDRPPHPDTIIDRCKAVWENFKGFNRDAAIFVVTHALAVV